MFNHATTCYSLTLEVQPFSSVVYGIYTEVILGTIRVVRRQRRSPGGNHHKITAKV